MTRETGGPAYPMSSYLMQTMVEGIQEANISNTKKEQAIEAIGASAVGMTLRDRFAIQAMLMNVGHGNLTKSKEEMAVVFYQMADAMLIARALPNTAEYEGAIERPTRTPSQ